MIARWALSVALALTVLVSALELSACTRGRTAASRPAPSASVAGVDTGPGAPAGVPSAPEVEATGPSMSPELTY